MGSCFFGHGLFHCCMGSVQVTKADQGNKNLQEHSTIHLRACRKHLNLSLLDIHTMQNLYPMILYTVTPSFYTSCLFHFRQLLSTSIHLCTLLTNLVHATLKKILCRLINRLKITYSLTITSCCSHDKLLITLLIENFGTSPKD